MQKKTSRKRYPGKFSATLICLKQMSLQAYCTDKDTQFRSPEQMVSGKTVGWGSTILSPMRKA